MQSVNAIQSVSLPQTKYGSHYEFNGMRPPALGAPSILGWFRILRTHYHWPLFQAIQYALWLTR